MHPDTSQTHSDLTEIRDALREFAEERDWHQFHTLRNLVLALTSEVGELAATVQWIPDHAVAEALRDDEFRAEFADELADCLAYLVQIADQANIDLATAVASKITKNAERYPVPLARGVSTKYTALGRASGK